VASGPGKRPEIGRRAKPRRVAGDHAPESSRRPRADAEPAERKADRVSRDLLGRIVSGEWSVGAVLPKEDELAESYRVNRGVVREAVKLLEVHRLVRPVRRRGTEVLEPLRSMSPEVLAAMLVPKPGRIDRRVLEAFLEVRALLDVEMTALAAARRTEADVRAMRKLLEQLELSLRDGQRYGKLVHEMAWAVARASKNPVFEMLSAFNARVVTDLESAFAATRPASREHFDGLRLLVDLVEAKNVEGAREIVAGFHAWAGPRILAAAALASGEPLPTVLEGMKT
jgi:GntR family transcriptional repressor for pyruvate dehydrogenase complex